jgi:hypothetical protein
VQKSPPLVLVASDASTQEDQGGGNREIRELISTPKIPISLIS